MGGTQHDDEHNDTPSSMTACFTTDGPEPFRDSAPKRRVLAFGDSLTAGFHSGGQAFEPYGATLAGVLGDDVAIEVRVCGLSGLTAIELARRQDAECITDIVGRCSKGIQRVLAEEGPFDLAIIMIGTNDLGTTSAPSEVIVAHAQSLHWCCHQMGVPTVALSVPPNLGTACSAGYLNQWQNLNCQLQQWVHGSSTAAGVAMFVDTAHILASADCHIWESDGIHLSPMGSQWLGRALAPLLRPLLFDAGSTLFSQLLAAAQQPAQQAAQLAAQAAQAAQQVVAQQAAQQTAWCFVAMGCQQVHAVAWPCAAHNHTLGPAPTMAWTPLLASW